MRSLRTLAILSVLFGSLLLADAPRSLAQDESIGDAALIQLGNTVVQLANAGDAEGLQGLFTSAIITCPSEFGPMPVCEGAPAGSQKQGYWMGPLYSEAAAIDYTNLDDQLRVSLDQVGRPLVMSTIADRAPFEFLRTQCATCRTLVLAGPADTAFGHSALLVVVRFTDNGLRIFSTIWGSTVSQDEQVFVTGGTYMDGTKYVRVGVKPPEVGTGIQRAGSSPAGWSTIALGSLALILAAYCWRRSVCRSARSGCE